MTPRVVSLLPSATEIVCALGFEHALVGRSHECDFPTGIRGLPVCTAARVDAHAPSEAIHAAVQDILRNDVSVYEVDAELLRRLAPTHIVTQIQCEVCAVSVRDVEAALGDWMHASAPRIVPLNPGSLDDVFDDIRRTAEALGCAGAGAALLQSMCDSMEEIARIAHDAEDKPRVATIEWLSPLMSAGNWMPELVERAGGRNLFGERCRHSGPLQWEELTAADPELLLIFPCGFPIEQTLRDMHHLTGRAGWNDLRAVRTGDVFIMDGNQFFNRPGPRLVDSLRIVAEILHPDRFAFGYQGQGWVQWTG